MDISNNNFSGDFPDVFHSLGKPEYFAASFNGFTGTLPHSLVNSASLVKLSLNSNFLCGPLSFNCSAMDHISTLKLCTNNFTDPIPDSLSTCKTLTTYTIDRNKICGQIPESFKNLQALNYLSLANTSITNISSALQILQHCKNLTMLILSNSFENEEMPNNVNLQFKRLKALIIPNCPLLGSLPGWLRRCTALEFVDLSKNYLSGSIPSWIGDFNQLFYLDLSYNSFTGEIPASLTTLPSLIDDNVSTGSFFSDFPLFKPRQNASALQYNGIGSFPTLDLSHNRFSGSIWPSFGVLRNLHVLDPSVNQLSGPIPASLSGMKSLEALDLSHNKLSGEIPSSLVALSFLSKFSVAFNQLNGEIPTGGQLTTFSRSSFEGNLGLCGTNYKPCEVEQSSPNAPQPGDGGMEILGMNFGIGIACGFVTSVTFCFTYPFKRSLSLGHKNRRITS